MSLGEHPIRVCLLLGRYPPDFGGWGIQYQRLLPHLAREGVEARVVTPRVVAGVDWRGDDDGIAWRVLPAADERGARLRSVLALRVHLHRHRTEYDVVHGAFNDWAFYLNVPWLGRHGIAVLHEMVLLGTDDPLTIRAGSGGALRSRLLRGIDAWVGISQAFRASVVGAGFAAERFHCIYPGVDLASYRPAHEEGRRVLRASLGIPQDARVVISVGAVLKRKGMDRLLHAWARLRPRPGRDLLLLVGPRTPQEGLRAPFLPHVRELEAFAEQPELTGTVRFVGRVDDVERWMAASDVFALLSQREGFGIVIAEAMGCGLPCVVTPLDGIAHEIVEEGRTGFVIDAPEDPEAVAACLGRLLDDPERRRAVGQAALGRARERFSLAGRAAALASLWRELADERRKGRRAAGQRSGCQVARRTPRA